MKENFSCKLFRGGVIQCLVVCRPVPLASRVLTNHVTQGKSITSHLFSRHSHGGKHRAFWRVTHTPCSVPRLPHSKCSVCGGEGFMYFYRPGLGPYLV